MLEILAAALLLAWVLGLVTGLSEGLAIHLLLLAAFVLLFIRHRSTARIRSSSMWAHHRALIPAPQARQPTGDVPLTPRANARSDRPASPAKSAPAPGRPRAGGRSEGASALTPRTPGVAAG